ncbi:MAG: glycosyltransferase family 39 protein [bacterium]|nr:glycosyltransferase family 39 protein [bacterium]
MSGGMPDTRHHSKRCTVIAVGFLSLVFLSLNLGGYDLWAPDEPRFGEVAREMLQSGDWLVPRVNDAPYLEKPPLFFWLIAGVSAPFGDVTETTARIPSVLAAVVTVLATYLLARNLFGPRVALWSAVVLCTNLRFWWQARTTQIDMVLTACLAVALLAFWMRHTTGETRWLVLFYGAIAAGVYAKGPVALLLPLLLILAFYWGRKEKRRSIHAWLGLGAAVALVLLWLIPARLAGSAELGQSAETTIGSNLFRQIVGRVFLGVSKKQPFWYYFEALPLDLAPWTLLLPWSLPWIWKHRKEGEGMRLLLAWVVPAFVVFSLMSGKRALYLLPLYPALAILLARSVLDLMDGNHASWRRRSAYAWAAIMVLLSSAPFVLLQTPYADIWTPAFLTITGACLVSALDTVVHAVKADANRLHVRLAGAIVAVAALAAVVVLPSINPHKSASAFCAPIRQLVADEAKFRLWSLGFSREEYIFYAHRAHTPFLVDDLPIPVSNDLSAEQAAQQLVVVGRGLHRATGGVEIADLGAVTGTELERLQGAASAVFGFARQETGLDEETERTIRGALTDFADDFMGPEPALMIAQSRDWKWLLAMAPRIRECHVLKVDEVGNREVVLIANKSAEALATS